MSCLLVVFVLYVGEDEQMAKWKEGCEKQVEKIIAKLNQHRKEIIALLEVKRVCKKKRRKVTK